MRKLVLITLGVLALSACKEESAALPQPIEMSPEAVGFYCQMDLLNHDGPKGQIHLAGLPVPIFFSQARDTIAYLHMPEQNHAVQVAYVQDMSHAASWAEPGDWIAADTAIYVAGSDKMGGMGAPEFVPFSDKAAALAFIAVHGGALLRFDEITPQHVLADAGAELAGGDQSDIANRLRALAPVNRTN